MLNLALGSVLEVVGSGLDTEGSLGLECALGTEAISVLAGLTEVGGGILVIDKCCVLGKAGAGRDLGD